MKPFFSICVVVALWLAAFFAFATTPCLAAATLTQQIDPGEVNVGDNVTVTLTIQNGTFEEVQLPQVDGLQLLPGSSTSTNFSFNNGVTSSSMSESFQLVPMRPGDFTIPAFDVHTQDGGVLHVKPMKLHVLGNGVAPATNNAQAQAVTPPAAPPVQVPNPFAAFPFNSHGPVVMPPNNTAQTPATPDNGNAADNTESNINVPLGTDGRPAKVFMVITPETTDVYVGQSIPLRIDWYIRQDVDYQQNSLPTIKGSDFLMNQLSYRPNNSRQMMMNEVYRRESWMTALSASKSGDFPLSMERDSYWVKSITTSAPGNGLDAFSFFRLFNRRANLAHEQIVSNPLTIHAHSLPTEGRPANFTGAIGQLKVTGEAQPASVAVGEPVTLRFTVSGDGNFDYIRCPALPDDPAWKTYVASSKTNYLDESHTRAVKTFEQSIIPQKNGNVPLPTASFSYFDPGTKQYVTVPVALPEITVTGSPLPVASTTSGSGSDSIAASAPPVVAGFLPNRLEIGATRTSLTPVYREPWFWGVQAGLISLPLVGALLLFLRSRSTPDNGRVERALRQRSLQQEEDAMTDAVRRGDAVAFFVAARHAIQLQLGAEWKVRAEAITLGEIRNRDAHLAETLEPLFAQADEVIYSGRASGNLDLAAWEHRVRSELLQPQPA